MYIHVPAEIIPPFNYTAYLNQTKRGVFTCHLREHAYTGWTINGVILNSDIFDSTGIVFNKTVLSDYTVSNLLIPANVANSGGVDIQCVAISRPASVRKTSNETAHFRVQGE